MCQSLVSTPGLKFSGIYLCESIKGMVQFNYNFTHAWYSMHGAPHVFACKIQKIAVCIIISTRRDVSLPETTRGICSKRVITRDVAVEVPTS